MKGVETDETVVPVMVVTNRLVSFSKDTPSVVDPSHPVDYSKREVPPNYKCGKCGATDCKLWREFQTFLEHQTLRCARCAAESEKRDISDIDDEGRYHNPEDVFPDRRTDQIGCYCPAVPTEENDSLGVHIGPGRGMQMVAQFAYASLNNPVNTEC